MPLLAAMPPLPLLPAILFSPPRLLVSPLLLSRHFHACHYYDYYSSFSATSPSAHVCSPCFNHVHAFPNFNPHYDYFAIAFAADCRYGAAPRMRIGAATPWQATIFAAAAWCGSRYCGVSRCCAPYEAQQLRAARRRVKARKMRVINRVIRAPPAKNADAQPFTQRV